MASEWLRPGRVQACYQVPGYLLHAWAKVGCPPLGRRLRSQADPDHVGYRLYSRSDVEVALANLKEPVDEFTDAGGRWVRTEVAAARYEVTPATLCRWHKVGCPWRGGKKLRVRARPFAHPGNRRLYPRWFFNVKELESAAVARAAGGAGGPAEWLTGPEARKEFRLSKSFLQTWSGRRCPLLGGRKLASELQPRAGDGRYGDVPKQRRVYWRHDLEEIARGRVPAAEADPNWLTSLEVGKRHALADPTLHYWREHNCTYLGGRKLRARRVPSVAANGRPIRMWQYYQPDLKLIAERMTGTPAGGVYRDDEGAWLSQRAAWETYAFYARTLIRWRTQGCPPLEGRKPNAKRVPLWSHRNKHGLEWVYSQRDLQKIAAVRRSGATGEQDRLERDGVAREQHQSEDFMPALYFDQFDISAESLRQARHAGTLDARRNDENTRWFYSVPKARGLWPHKFGPRPSRPATAIGKA